MLGVVIKYRELILFSRLWINLPIYQSIRINADDNNDVHFDARYSGDNEE